MRVQVLAYRILSACGAFMVEWEGAPCPLLYKGTNYIHALITFLRPHPQILLYWEVGFSIGIWGEDTDFQFIALPL